VKFITREPVKQIPVDGEEVLWIGNQVGMSSSLIVIQWQPHVFFISEARPYGRVQEGLDVANSETTITRTRRSSALLNVIDDRLSVWLWNETRSMGVIPGTLLTILQRW
jgi:hypothetical protein